MDDDGREIEKEREGSSIIITPTPTRFIFNSILCSTPPPAPSDLDYAFDEIYEIIEAIGTLTCTGTTLYRARHILDPHSHLPIVLHAAFVYVNENDRVTIARLKDEQKKLYKLDLEIGNHSFLGAPDFCTFTNSGYYCQSFCCSAEHGSLLSFMARRFPRGLPEKWILFFVRPVIRSLHHIHTRRGGGEPHRQISAANVFVHQHIGYVNASLAYGASLHLLFSDKLRDSANPSYLPPTSASTWAAAPPPPPQNKHDERADDIWLIGILLLEMAYGGLRVRDRGELDSILQKIRTKNKLPKRLNDDYNTHSKSKRPYLPACFNPKKTAVAPVGLEYMPEERVFSRKFLNFVIRCLNPDPTKRPTAIKLDRSKIFNNTRARDLPVDILC